MHLTLSTEPREVGGQRPFSVQRGLQTTGDREGEVGETPKERFSVTGGEKETTLSERSDAVSGNPSTEGLLMGSNAHLSRSSFTSSKDAAKLRKNTEITLRSESYLILLRFP